MNLKKLTSSNFDEIVKEASAIMKNGGVVIAPFDTVYGFLCDSRNDTALEKVFELKNRNRKKTIGVAMITLIALKRIVTINDENFIKSRVPGPYTFILPLKENKFSKYCTEDDTVAVRIPDSELIAKIIKGAGFILAQTSANLSGQSICSSVEQIVKQFDALKLDQVDLIIDGGEITGSAPSQIYDMTGNQPLEIDR